MRPFTLLLLLATLLIGSSLSAATQELTVYSARHYQTDRELYASFTERTGIKVHRIYGTEDELLERLLNEGGHNRADVLITVDAARLSKAEELGLFTPVKSQIFDDRIPGHLRTDTWVAFSTRARVLMYNKETLNSHHLRNYADLADPKFRNQVCSRSGFHPYNLSLLASLITHYGAHKAEAWAAGVFANLARAPKGGDTDQIRAVAAGECSVAISNTYYLARLMQSANPADRAVAEKIGIIWPNQTTQGVHINISGGGVLKNASNKEAAVKFLEFLTSDEAQIMFARGNNEWPVVPTVKYSNDALKAMGVFKSDTLPLERLVENVSQARTIFDRTGWQ